MSEDERAAMRAMQEMVERARVMDMLAKIILGLGILFGFGLIVRLFGL